MTNREYVEQHWGKVYTTLRGLFLSGYRVSENRDDWREAARYTRDRLEQIRQAQGDIENLRDWGEDLPVECAAFASYQRIVVREIAALQDLKRGLKENL